MTRPIKNGERHIASLRDNRTVYIDGTEVRDVTTHPAFRNSVASSARMYDLQAQEDNIEAMTFESPTSGGRVSRAWQIPKNHAEMVERRKALVAWAETHCGFMGRSPDHLASALTGQYMGLDRWKEYDEGYARNFADYYHYARDHDHFLTYVIINPQIDRSKDTSEQEDGDVIMRVVDEDSEGITVRGAKMMGTSSIMANEVFVANLQPLRPDESKYAVSFALPMNTKGVKVLSRKSFEASAVSTFDNPLSSRYDENDAVLYFDDVKVPWNRVFVNQDVGMARAQFHETPGHVFQNYQAQIRLMVKLKFLAGIARKTAETIGTIKMPPVQTMLGKLASDAAAVEAFVFGMEAAGEEFNGAWIPNRHMLYAAQVFTQEMYANFVNSIRELAGGALIMLPSSAQEYSNPEAARIFDKVQVGAQGSSRERVKFFKMAWDALGSEFAGRHTHYESFYAGAQFVTRGHSFRSYDWDGALELVDTQLSGYSLEDCLPEPRKRA
ncbi:MAG: 4-hydroxyphenylacetate 3-hydroxylase N-terminal domain-containing protein [Pseudomonadota bacterium]